MKNKHINGLLLMAVASLILPGLVLGQTNATVFPDISGNALPSTVSDYWKWAIAGVTPMLVAGVNSLVPKIPKVLLPLSTPLLGIGLGAGLNALTSANLTWVDMAQAGALAVFVREVVNQAVKARSSAEGPTS